MLHLLQVYVILVECCSEKGVQHFSLIFFLHTRDWSKVSFNLNLSLISHLGIGVTESCSIHGASIYRCLEPLRGVHCMLDSCLLSCHVRVVDLGLYGNLVA